MQYYIDHEVSTTDEIAARRMVLPRISSDAPAQYRAAAPNTWSLDQPSCPGWRPHATLNTCVAAM